jgi:hypothetical protein
MNLLLGYCLGAFLKASEKARLAAMQYNFKVSVK